MRVRTAIGLAVLLVFVAIGSAACSGTQSSPSATSPVIGDLAGVEIDVHKAPG